MTAFVDIVNKGTYNDLMKLYYKCKGFCMTGTADFAQQVVVEFMEEYCIEIKEKLKNNNNQLSINPINNKRRITISNDSPKLLNLKRSRITNFTKESSIIKFGDDWYTEFSRHPSVRCETNYACNTGSSKIPMILQSHLYFRKRKYYLNLYSDPFVSCSYVTFMFSMFLDILHKQIIKQNTNPWNLTLHTTYHYPSDDDPHIIYLTFEYDNVKDIHVIVSSDFNRSLTNILDQMHKHEKFMTVFAAAYSCEAGWGYNNGETVGGAHAVACGLIKDNRNVFVFILDPNGVQVQGPKWWQKYTEVFFKNTGKKISKSDMVENFFNKTILGVLIDQINEKYPRFYECTYDPKVNLNPHNFNFGGSDYQEDGYCLLISYYFIHILYNNIAIHNRDIFNKISDYREIVKYIENLMKFIYEVLYTEPFKPRDFFYNYSINIFRFMLSFDGIEECYETFDLAKMKKTINAKFQNSSYFRGKFSAITSANVIMIYMDILLNGGECVPSLIGVPKPNIPNYKNMLQRKDYSCIKFYTPFRNIKLINEQPLRSWFINDKEQVKFFDDDSICIIDNDRYKTKNTDYTNCKIYQPTIVLLHLKKVLRLYNVKKIVNDFSIMTPSNVSMKPSTCMNIKDPFGNTSTCVIS